MIYMEVVLSTAVFKKDPIEIVGASELRRVGTVEMWEVRFKVWKAGRE